MSTGLKTDSLFVVEPAADKTLLEETRQEIKDGKTVVFEVPHRIDMVQISRILQQAGYFPSLVFERKGVTYSPSSHCMVAIPYPVGTEWTHSHKCSYVKWGWVDDAGPSYDDIFKCLREFLGGDRAIPELQFPD